MGDDWFTVDRAHHPELRWELSLTVATMLGRFVSGADSLQDLDEVPDLPADVIRAASELATGLEVHETIERSGSLESPSR